MHWENQWRWMTCYLLLMLMILNYEWIVTVENLMLSHEQLLLVICMELLWYRFALQASLNCWGPEKIGCFSMHDLVASSRMLVDKCVIGHTARKCNSFVFLDLHTSSPLVMSTLSLHLLIVIWWINGLVEQNYPCLQMYQMDSLEPHKSLGKSSCFQTNMC